MPETAFDVDAYLAEKPGDSSFDVDAYLGIKPATAFDADAYLQGSAELAQADEQQAMERDASMGGAPQWAKNAAEAAVKVGGGFIPRSVSDAAHLLTPVLGSTDELKHAYQIGKDVVNGASLAEATRKHAPEAFQLLDAGQTPALSKERFEAGFNTVAQALMAASIAKGLRPKVGEVPKPELRPEEASEVSLPDASPETPLPTAVSTFDSASQVHPSIRTTAAEEFVPETAVARDVPIESQAENTIGKQEASTASVEAQGPMDVLDKSVREQFRDSSGVIDLPAATQHIGQAVNDALSRGETVRLVADFGRKTVPIVRVRNGQLIDAKGQAWGTFDVLSGGSKIEIARKAPSVPEPNEAGAPLPKSTIPAQQTPTDLKPQTSSESPLPTREPVSSETQIPRVESEVSAEEISQPETTPTSTKNAITSAERENRGIAPAVETARREFGTVWDQAERTAATDPTAPQRLVESLADNPRALSDHENALLLRRQIEVQNEHDAAIRAVNEATDSVSKQDAQARLDKVRDDLQQVYDAAKVAGTETGRGLAARKMLANNDYSLTKMQATWRAVTNEGKPLNRAQVAEVTALHERIKAAEEKLAGYEAQQAFNDALKQAKAEGRKSGAFKVQSFLDREAQRARERITARRGKLFVDPIGVTQVAHLADEAIIGASHLARGVTKFADWSAQMIAEFGERIKPFLRGLYSKAHELNSKAGKGVAPNINEVRAANLQKQIADLEKRIRSGDTTPQQRAKVGYTEATARLRTQRDQLKEQLQAIEEEKNPPPSPEQRGLASDKKAIQTRTEKLREKTEAGDFEKPAKKPARMDKEKADLLFEYAKAREAYNRGLFEAKLARQTKAQKVYRAGMEVANTARALQTSYDASALLRQGGIIGLSHPIRAGKAIPAMIRAMSSERATHRINAEIMSRENAPLYVQAKLFIADESATSLSKMEEVYMSRFIQNPLPGPLKYTPLELIRRGALGSQRGYTTFLNRLRADSFDAMAASLGRAGKLTLPEARAVANYVNIATGRGDLAVLGQAANALNAIFYAPRLVASRFQFLAGQPLYKGSARTRRLIATEYARFIAGVASVSALGLSAGATMVLNDPTSPDFLKLKFGNTRLDMYSGLGQVTVFSAREAGAIKRFVTQSKQKDPKYGSGGEVLWRFLRTKLGPVPGETVNALYGKDVVGNKVTPATAAASMVTPMSFGDIKNALEDQGMERGAALGALSLFGAGLQTYGKKH